MASTKSQASKLNVTSVTEDGNSLSSTSAEGEHDNTTIQKETEPNSSEAALDKLKETVVSLQDELATEKKLRIKLGSDLTNVKKQWKQVTRELSKQQTDAKPFHTTVTDDFLKGLVETLRYDVQSFSESFFGHLSPQQPWPQPDTQVQVFPKTYEQCPASPVLAQSFVWRILSNKVFEKYRWPADVGSSFYNVSVFLQPNIIPNGTEGPSEYEALKKFHVWRATTANMVFSKDDPMDSQETWKRFETKLIEGHIVPIISHLVPREEHQRCYNLLGQIIQKAMNLDREISMQGAWVRWIFEDSDTNHESNPINREELRVIVAPAMVKRGKSSGEGFEEQIELLPADTYVVSKLPLLSYRIAPR